MNSLTAALNRPLVLYAALLGGVFLVALIAGYVYSHEPQRDQLVLEIDRSGDTSGNTVVGGTLLEIHDDRVVVDHDGLAVELQLSADAPLEELRGVDGAFAPGSLVNVGAQQTSFGFVLTGIVAVEGANAAASGGPGAAP